jgi:hypothetical protein
MNLLSLEQYGMIKEMWFYLTLKDKIHLSEVSKELIQMSIRMNKEIDVIIRLPNRNRLTRYDTVEKKMKMLANLLRLFPNISKMFFGRGVAGNCLSVLYNCESICESLKGLEMSVTDDGLIGISKLRNLRSLKIFDCVKNDFPYGGFYHLSLLTNIQSLDLSGCGDLLNDKKGTRYLSCLTNLTFLNVNQSENEDVGLPFLDSLTKLEILKANSCHFLPGDLIRLYSLVNLTYFDLSGDVEFDFFFHLPELIQLSTLTNLLTLEFSSVNCPDEGFQFL